MQTFNELTSERLNEIKLNLMQRAIDKGLAVEGEIKDVGNHKAIWISISGGNKVYDVLFMEKGYLWDFTTTVPYEYSRDMDEEMENLIKSFRMIEESEKVQEKSLTALEWYWKGSRYERMHEYSKAIDIYSQAIKLYPKDASLYCGRASSYSALGEYELSLADYSKSIELDQLNFGYYHNRGNFYNKFKKYDLAIADYSRAIELNGGFFTRKARGNTYMMIYQYIKIVVM
jgi:tetratricopeptide (TPR) repeat protein